MDTLFNDRRGSMQETLLPIALVGLAALGGLASLGGGMRQAIAGAGATGSSASLLAPTPGSPGLAAPRGASTPTPAVSSLAGAASAAARAAEAALKGAGATGSEVKRAFRTADEILSRQRSGLEATYRRYGAGDTLYVVADEADVGARMAHLKEVSPSLAARVQKHAKRAGYRGTEGQRLELPGGKSGFERVVVLGRRSGGSMFDLDSWREVGEQIARDARSRSSTTKPNQVHLASTHQGSDALRHLVEGATLGDYSFDAFRSGAAPRPAIRLGVTAGTNADDATDAKRVTEGVAAAEATALARDLVNYPPNVLNTREMVALASRVADQNGLGFRVYGGKDLVKERLLLLEGVGRASENPPFLVELTHQPKGARGKVALVGKSLMFDSGGLSLKTGGGMRTMKQDMGGGAAVLGAASAAKRLGVEQETHFFLPIAENSINGRAQRVDDIRTGRSGKSVEIGNTDAEGRLVMADAIALAAEGRPDAIVDLATLTGANASTFGELTAGVMGTSDDLVARLLGAGKRSGEALWPMPLDPRLRPSIGSSVADLSNIGAGGGGSITAGLFLAEHVPDGIPFAHLDIAGPAFGGKGGTGFGVRTLLRYLEGE